MSRGTLLMSGLAAAAALTEPAASQATTGLEQAVQNFPQLIIGANTRVTDGTGPFARPCPDGGSVTQISGVTTSYHGSIPGRRTLCRVRIGGTDVEAWYGIWLTTWPGSDQAAAAMDRLIHGRTGQTEAFDVRMSPAFSFHDVLRNDGVETIRLLDCTYQALKISHYREGAEGNIYRSVTTGWKDMATGMLLYVTYQHISGSPEIGVPVLPAAIDPLP